MKVLRLLRAEAHISGRRFLFLAGAAGITNVVILAIINTAASHAANRQINLRLALMFVIAVILYVLAQRAVMATAVTEIERAIHRIRLRLIQMLQQTDLTAFEHIGRSAVYAAITKETSIITQAAPTLVVGAQAAVLIVFAGAYVASLSVLGFLVGAAFMVVATVTQSRRMRQLVALLHRAATRENDMFDRLSDILAGFKELKMSSRRAREVFADISDVSAEAAELRVTSQVQFVTEFVRIQVVFFLLPASVVFLVPRFSNVASEDVVKMTAAMLFLIGPITSLGQSIQMLSTLNVAAENILTLQETLAGAVLPARPAPAPGLARDFAEGFREITLDNVTFQHRFDGTQGFMVGPVNLTIRAGEMLFIGGGNGSGKSTLIKVLAGLYKPTTGVIRVDGRPLSDDEYPAYRDRIAAIFSDYHLFKRLFGVDPPAPERAQELLEHLGIQDKTRIIGDRFETVDLSFGQRKRLALMVALLEDKPLMIFDEWAAEQDPVFRARFYREILPALKRAGKTLLVVTHDDRYFDVADRRLRMEEGVFVTVTDAEKGKA